MDIDQRIEALTSKIEALTVNAEAVNVNIETLHSSVSELYGAVQGLITDSKQDGENIRALVRIAEIHERRLSDIEGGDTKA